MKLRIAAILFAGFISTYSQTSSHKALAVQAPTEQQENSIASIASGESKINPEKEADIRRLLDITGTKKLVEQSMDRTMQNIRPLLIKALPQGEYREKLINLFIEKFRAKADGQQIINLAVPVYDKHFSHEEIKGLIKFYETPLGQKAISELPRTASELSEAGTQWGEKLGGACMSEVLAENPDLAEAIKAAGK